SALIRRLRSDDPAALQSILDRYWDRLVAFAHRFVGEAGDPESQVQEALARLWARRHLLDEEGSLKALLYTTVRNLCLDELRRRDRRNRLDGKAPSPTPVRTPWEDVHGAELQRAAATAVARLPARRQEVFRLVREEGLSYHEVARVLELSPQTVANHMSLAMADLRTALKPFLPSSQPRSVEGSRASPSRDLRGGEIPLG
ncbi:MAG: sigma-70 family RNA polymerase sigma factor, partial [Gemmatimonadota bacterium]